MLPVPDIKKSTNELFSGVLTFWMKQVSKANWFNKVTYVCTLCLSTFDIYFWFACLIFTWSPRMSVSTLRSTGGRAVLIIFVLNLQQYLNDNVHVLLCVSRSCFDCSSHGRNSFYPCGSNTWRYCSKLSGVLFQFRIIRGPSSIFFPSNVLSFLIWHGIHTFLAFFVQSFIRIVFFIFCCVSICICLLISILFT